MNVAIRHSAKSPNKSAGPRERSGKGQHGSDGTRSLRLMRWCTLFEKRKSPGNLLARPPAAWPRVRSETAFARIYGNEVRVQGFRPSVLSTKLSSSLLEKQDRPAA